MFTGLVQAVGRIATVEPRQSGVRLTVDPGGWAHRPEPAESIAVSGVCLTLAAPVNGPGSPLAFDVVRETLDRTVLGEWRPGARVNLERSLAAGDLMGGHVVQGHVDGIGSVEDVQTGSDYRVTVRPPAHLMACIAPKGSVAIDGVSLTIARVDVERGSFEVALIPTTLELTTLGGLRPGGRCNLETDILARTVVHYLRHYARPG